MQVQFTPEQEAQLSQLADHSGTDAEHMVREAALRLLHEDARLREGVERGMAAGNRGDFVDHAQVWANIESILQP